MRSQRRIPGTSGAAGSHRPPPPCSAPLASHRPPGPLPGRSGHRTVMLAQPRRPQPSPAQHAARSQASGDAGREERGQVSGTAGDSGEGMGLGAAMLLGMVPACRKCLRAAGRQARPCPGDAQGPGSVPALVMPAGSPAGGSPAAPRCLMPVPAPATGQIRGTAKPLCPAALPGRCAHCTGTRANPGQGMGWGEPRMSNPMQAGIGGMGRWAAAPPAARQAVGRPRRSLLGRQGPVVLQLCRVSLATPHSWPGVCTARS